jgi:hypothetical protein
MSLTQGMKMILTAAALTLLGSLLQLHWGMELFFYPYFIYLAHI